MSRRLAVAALAAALLAAGCPRATPDREVAVTVRAAAAGGLDLGELRIEPAAAILRAERVAPGRVELVAGARAAGGRLVFTHPDACPAEARPPAGGETVEVELRPWIDLGPDRPQVGFDVPFEVVVRAGCAAAAAGRVDWRQLSGPAATFTAGERGFVLRGRTPALAAARPGPLPRGIVPFSPANRGELVFEAVWRGDGHAEVRRVLRVAAASRASGIPSVGLGHRVVLSGTGWRLAQAPAGGHAILVDEAGVTTIEPDATGRWVLADGAGAELALRAGRADELPLDCGRAECHPAAAAGVALNKMSSVLARALDGTLREGADPRCGLACHAAGEPGLPDGGFAHVAAELGVALPARGAPGGWAALPRALRRVGGVGCIACHGAAAIPERPARWSVLRADVCAVCHDAPPRYGHVAAWRSSRMARADASPGTSEGRCAGCHTTSGFLAALGVRPLREDGAPPAAVGPVGVACAACHAPHGDHIGRALVRRVAPPPLFVGALPDGSPAGVCLRCHGGAGADGDPDSSAAALVFARGGVRAASGEPLGGDAPHGAAAGGCLGCHAGAPTDTFVERGGGHTFRVAPARCAPCHDGGALAERPGADGRLVAERARALFAELVPAGAGAPPHAAPLPPAASPELARARRNVLIVLEDPAAGAHNAAYARALLDDAESLVKSRSSR